MSAFRAVYKQHKTHILSDKSGQYCTSDHPCRRETQYLQELISPAGSGLAHTLLRQKLPGNLRAQNTPCRHIHQVPEWLLVHIENFSYEAIIPGLHTTTEPQSAKQKLTPELFIPLQQHHENICHLCRALDTDSLPCVPHQMSGPDAPAERARLLEHSLEHLKQLIRKLDSHAGTKLRSRATPAAGHSGYQLRDALSNYRRDFETFFPEVAAVRGPQD